MGVFKGRLGLANAAKAAQCHPSTLGECLLDLRQQLFPVSKKRVAIRKI
jgi:hypothetical protein